ncbi:MAG TPA: F0F1 ATP synthase subunit B [Limnochordia bacterium]
MPIGVALAAEAAETASPVTFDGWTFAFQAINIFVVLFVLYWFMFRPVGRLIERRQQFVRDSLAEARTAREEAERLLQEYRTKLQEAQREAQGIVERATRAAEERRAAIVEEARAEAERQLERARQEIRAEREQALAAIRQQAADLVVAAASKVIGRAIDGEDQRRMAREFVEKAGLLQ